MRGTIAVWFSCGAASAVAAYETLRRYCIGCVKATSPTYWNTVRQHFPDEFQKRAELSRDIGARLVRYKGRRIFLDELPPHAAGRPLKDTLADVECGIFCATQGELDL